jgi:hypothetical protein
MEPVEQFSCMVHDYHAVLGPCPTCDKVTVPSYLKPYDGQAHHMAKAAQSLVLMLGKIDYSVFSLDDAARITAQFHELINKIEFVQKYPNLDRQ